MAEFRVQPQKTVIEVGFKWYARFLDPQPPISKKSFFTPSCYECYVKILRVYMIVQNGSGLPLRFIESLHFISLLVGWNTSNTVFIGLNINFDFWRNARRIVMS